MRGQGADVQPVVADGDLFEFAQARHVDDHFRIVDSVLELDQEVGSAGQDLGLGAVLAEQRHGVPNVFSHYVSERLHPVRPQCQQMVRCNIPRANRQNGARIRNWAATNNARRIGGSARVI